MVTERASLRTSLLQRTSSGPTLSLRVVAVDKAQRLVELVATSEAIDTFGTRFSYEASKDAFSRALGNVREMHQDIAIGNIVKWQPDDKNRQIRVWVYVSEGAPDTWTKVLDGTLKGGSIGASNVTWQRGLDGVPVATRYDLVEFSLVDNPSNPDCRIVMVRMATLREMTRDAAKRREMVERGVMTTQRKSTGPGAIPAQQLDPAPAPIGDVMLTANQTNQGKLVIATSNDPKAPDYGVPPVVGVRGTAFADGQGGNLAMTATTGGFWDGGHPTAGASMGPGVDPMPETQIGGYSVGQPIFDEENPVNMDPYHDQLRPNNDQLPVGGTLGGKRGRAPTVVQTVEGPMVLVPPRQYQQLVQRDDGGMLSDTMGGMSGVGTGTAAGDASGSADTSAQVAMAVSPQWHRVAHSALHHAAGIMSACGCPMCTNMAAKARTMRDAFAADAAADSVGDMSSTTTGTASAATRPQTARQAATDPRFQQQVVGAFSQFAQVMANLTDKVDQIAAQPVPGGPVAMQTRGFQGMPVDQQIRTLTEFAQRSGDPNVQMEAASAILMMQQAGPNPGGLPRP